MVESTGAVNKDEKFHSRWTNSLEFFFKSYLPGASMTKVTSMVVNSVFQFNKTLYERIFGRGHIIRMIL